MMASSGKEKRPLGQRIIIIGNTGSGKTTLGQTLSPVLGIPHTEIDALHWRENWTTPTPAEFRQLIEQAIAPDAWILDGNYSSVRDLIWQRADSLIWLDYALPVVLWQLGRRTFRRAYRQELLWNGNRTTWRRLFSRDSLFLWAVKKHWSRRQLYNHLLQQSAYAHLTVYHFHAPRELRAWLTAVIPNAPAHTNLTKTPTPPNPETQQRHTQSNASDVDDIAA